MANDVDISENGLLHSHPEVLRKLLLDHTTHKNIFWATESYAHLGEGFGFDDEITVEHITGENGCIVQPRAVKAAEVQTQCAKVYRHFSWRGLFCYTRRSGVLHEIHQD